MNFTFFPRSTADAHLADYSAYFTTLSEQLQLPPLSVDEEIEMAQLAMVLSHMQEQWLDKTEALIRSCWPKAASASLENTLLASAMLCKFAQQRASLRQTTENSQARLARLWTAHPQKQPQPCRANIGDQDQFNHYTYPLGQLLQELPADISNQSNLTREQIQKCKSTAALAQKADATLQDGLYALGRLQEIAERHATDKDMPAIGPLMAYLSGQSRFMAHCALEYGVAGEPRRR